MWLDVLDDGRVDVSFTDPQHCAAPPATVPQACPDQAPFSDLNPAGSTQAAAGCAAQGSADKAAQTTGALTEEHAQRLCAALDTYVFDE